MTLLFPVLLIAVLALLLAASVRRSAVGVIGFVLLVTLYYVIRGTGGQTAFVFVWPYLFIGAYLHLLGVKAMAARRAPRNAWYGVYAGYALLVLLLLVTFGFVRDAMTRPLPQVITQFNDWRVALLGVIGAGLVAWPLAWTGPRTWRSTLTAADWIVVAFVGYGLFQILLSVARTGHLFYTLESFRYYFAMALVYFAARFGLESRRDVAILAVALVAGGTLVASEYIFEHYLFNAGVSSLELPWLRAFDEMFTGYGRPMPVDGFYVVTDYTESHYLPYYGTRAIGLVMHPHTAGMLAAMMAALVIPPLFDRDRRWGVWLSLLVGLLFYAALLSIARSAVMLFYVVILAMPMAVAWLLRARFTKRRLIPYAAAVALALASASFWSPGGPLPYLHFGWYERPILFTARAVMGDMLVWDAGQRDTAPSQAPRRGAAGAAQAEALPPPPPPAPPGPSHSTAAPGDALAVAASLVSATRYDVLLIGAGFSPMTKYVVDYFPEAAGFRHVSSTSDVALLEFMLQFGVLGLGALLVMFGIFGWEGVLLARLHRAGPLGQFGLAATAIIVITLVSMLHLYPLFRIGVNTSFYALLGAVGFLRAERLRLKSESETA